MPSRLSFCALSVAETVEPYVWNIPAGQFFFFSQGFYSAASGMCCSFVTQSRAAGYFLDGLESNQRAAKGGLRMGTHVPIFAHPLDPYLRGLSLKLGGNLPARKI